MTKHPDLQGMSIRSAVVRSPGSGLILGAVRALADKDKPHTAILRLADGAFVRTDVDFSAHSCCAISTPEEGFVALSATGRYLVDTPRGQHQGNIFDEGSPPPDRIQYGDFRCVAEIGGVAHAVGLGGMAYRMEAPGRWTRIDSGLPDSFNAETIHGFTGSELYAAGFRGQIWRRDDRNWLPVEMPTNIPFNVIRCMPDARCYAGGKRGLLATGRGSSWELIEDDELDASIWGLAWFQDELWISTMEGVFVRRNGALVPVSIEDAGEPVSTYLLSAAPDVLWSVGEFDLMAFDGKTWTRVA